MVWPAGQLSEVVLFSAAVPQIPVVGVLTVALQVTWAARRFDVPGQGSPKLALLAETIHEAFPMQAFESSETELAAAHVPCLNAPHEPVGVP
jgi:hypothetical protein